MVKKGDKIMLGVCRGIKNICLPVALILAHFNMINVVFLNCIRCQRRIQNPVKHLRWGTMRKFLTALNRSGIN